MLIYTSWCIHRICTRDAGKSPGMKTLGIVYLDLTFATIIAINHFPLPSSRSHNWNWNFRCRVIHRSWRYYPWHHNCSYYLVYGNSRNRCRRIYPLYICKLITYILLLLPSDEGGNPRKETSARIDYFLFYESSH